MGTRHRCGRVHSARRLGRAARAGRSSRWAAPVARARPAPRGRAAALPPQLALVDLLALPEAGGEVLPASVGQDADDDAIVELLREPSSHMEDGAARHTREDPFAVKQGVHPRHRLLVRDEELPVELRDVEDRRDVALVERAKAHHRVTRERLRGSDDDLGEALAQPLAGAHQRAAGAEPGYEDVDAVEALGDLRARAVV